MALPAISASSSSVEPAPEENKRENEPFPEAFHPDFSPKNCRSRIEFFKKVVEERPKTMNDLKNIFQNIHNATDHQIGQFCCSTHDAYIELRERVEVFSKRKDEAENLAKMDPRFNIPAPFLVSNSSSIRLKASELLSCYKKALNIYEMSLPKPRKATENKILTAEKNAAEYLTAHQGNAEDEEEQDLGVEKEQLEVQNQIADRLLDQLLGELVRDLNQIQARKDQRDKRPAS